MLNQIQIIGRVGRDPEIRYLPSGDAVVNVSVATTETWKDKNTQEKQEKTQWHRAKAFGKLAEIIGQYWHKGDVVFFQGSMEYGKFTNKDGQEVPTADVRITEMKLLPNGRRDGEGASQEGGGAPAPAPRPQQGRAPASAPKPSTGFDDMDDDIPF